MNDPANDRYFTEKDGFRLIGLSRIPRCAACGRLAAFRRAFDRDAPLVPPLPAVPANCRRQVCRPLVARFVRASRPVAP